MPQRGDIPVNNFVKGLVTEASPLTFPPGASLDEVNFELLRDGSRRKRLGLDLEDNYGLHTSNLDAAVLEGARCQAYRWSIPNGNIDQDIGVIQIGNQIWFIDLYTANPSANILNGGNPVVATELNNDVIMTFTTLNNYLIGVANHLAQPYLFNYDPVTDTVSVETASITVRDMWGVDDGLAVDGRPTALSAAHHYNLLNQGWLPDIQSTCGAGISAIDCTFNTFGIYPSNSDAWTYGRVEDLTSVDLKKFDPDIAGRNFVNNGNVARGHFLISLYERGVSRSNQTGLTLPVDRETGRINAIAAFAGRIFYAGILSKVVGGDSRSPNLSGTVLFSQLFENKLNLVKCYQEADPTSPDINDIVDTDGGLIQIPECGYIWALKPIKESLFVFASNGVWEIRGGDNGFTATSFMVHKISNVGVYAPKSIIEVEGIIYFWAATGIHAIGRNENGVFQTSNLTIPTIQKLYNAIPDASKKNARGYYDLAQNRARWLYYSPETKEFGEAIDIDETPAPIYTLMGAPLQITDASISPSVLSIVRITDTKYVIVFNHTSISKIQYVVCNTDETSFAVTATAAADLVTGLVEKPSFIKAVSIDEDKFLLTYSITASATDDMSARIVNIVGNVCTADSAVTITSHTGGRTLSDVITIDSNRALVSIGRNPSLGTPEALVINYSTGTPVMGPIFVHPDNQALSPILRILTVDAISTAMYYDEARAKVLSISSSDVITGGSSLNLSAVTFVGGGRYIGEISNTNLVVANRDQFAVITKTNPPTLVASYSATDNALTENYGSPAHNFVRVPNKNEVIRYLIDVNNKGRYQYIGTSGSTVVEVVAPTVLVGTDPNISFITPITLNQSIASSVWAAITTANRKIITQMLRLV